VLNSHAGGNQCAGAKKPTAASGGAGLTADDAVRLPRAMGRRRKIIVHHLRNAVHVNAAAAAVQVN